MNGYCEFSRNSKLKQNFKVGFITGIYLFYYKKIELCSLEIQNFQNFCNDFLSHFTRTPSSCCKSKQNN